MGMLTGTHKIGERGMEIEFGTNVATFVDADGYEVFLDYHEARDLRDLLNRHFGEPELSDEDGWTLCDDDGPFPPIEEEVDVTVSVSGYSRPVRKVKIAQCDVWYVKPFTTWVGIEKNEIVVAWRPRPKPCQPERGPSAEASQEQA